MRTRVLSGILAVTFAALLFAAAGTTAHASNYGNHGGYYGGHGNVHCMKYGETLYGVAAMYGTTAWAIANANGIVNPNYVRAGQCLTIPTGYHGGYAQPKPAPYYGGYAQPKPAPYYGGYGHNANYNYHHGNKGGYGHTHCMKYGETLSGVAAMYGTSAWAIANANGIKNPNYVRAGTCLTIPRW